MSDDLAKWGRILYRSLKRGFHITPGEIQVVQLMVDRIEELEAELVKAVEALEAIVGDDTWGMEHEAYMKCRATLKELKGELK